MSTLAAAETVALDFLGNTVNDPPARARRIAGIYASCYLQDPLLGAWFGLATYVARRVHVALEGPASVWRPMMADGNLAIYMGMVPSWLLFRAGHPVPGPLSLCFTELRLAGLAMSERDLSLAEIAVAQARADQATANLARIEQEDILQPTYDALDGDVREPLRRLFSFRLGLAPTAPVIAWDNSYGAPWVASERLDWMNGRVLPAWQLARQNYGAVVRAENDRTRRWGRMTLAELEAGIALL